MEKEVKLHACQNWHINQHLCAPHCQDSAITTLAMRSKSRRGFSECSIDGIFYTMEIRELKKTLIETVQCKQPLRIQFCLVGVCISVFHIKLATEIIILSKEMPLHGATYFSAAREPSPTTSRRNGAKVFRLGLNKAFAWLHLVNQADMLCKVCSTNIWQSRDF